MMKSVLVAALMTASTVAVASNARLADLQGSLTSATDIQEGFLEPAKMWSVGDAFLVEYGSGFAPVANTPRAQGVLVRTMGNAKLGVWFGRQSDSLLSFANGVVLPNGTLLATGLAGTNTKYLDNPFNVSYAMKGDNLTWGAGLFYANSQDKKGTDQFKKNAMGLNLSAVGSNWSAFFNMGLGAKIEVIGADTANTNQEALTMKNNMRLGGQYDMDDISVGASYQTIGGKHTPAAGGTDDWDVETTALALAVESKVKTDNAHFFYGAGINMDSAKNKVAPETKVDMSYMPLWLGVEADAASWLTIRSAYKQNFSFFDTSKQSDTTGDLDSKSGASTNTVTAGAAFKFNKTTVDFNWAVATSGALSTAGFGTNAALTYNF